VVSAETRASKTKAIPVSARLRPDIPKTKANKIGLEAMATD